MNIHHGRLTRPYWPLGGEPMGSATETTQGLLRACHRQLSCAEQGVEKGGPIPHALPQGTG